MSTVGVMKTKLKDADEWDFDRAAEHFGLDIREKGKNFQRRSIVCRDCNKTIKLRKDFSAGHFVDHYKNMHKNRHVENQGSILSFLQPISQGKVKSVVHFDFKMT